jgi:hypothetical protein
MENYNETRQKIRTIFNEQKNLDSEYVNLSSNGFITNKLDYYSFYQSQARTQVSIAKIDSAYSDGESKLITSFSVELLDFPEDVLSYLDVISLFTSATTSNFTFTEYTLTKTLRISTNPILDIYANIVCSSAISFSMELNAILYNEFYYEELRRNKK